MTRDNNTSKNLIKAKYDKFYNRYLSTPIKRKVLGGKVIELCANFIKYFLLYGLCFVILYPLIQQLAIAIRPPQDINDPSVLWIPNSFSLDNITMAMAALNYWQALKNSFLISAGVCILTVISTALAGYVFARMKFKGLKVLFAFVILLIIIPQSTIELPLKLLLVDLGLLGNPIILFMFAFLCVGIRSGIFIFLFRQFFRNVPEELEEAAYVDGASPFQVFYKIMLPNVSGGILTVGILSFVWQWNDSYFTSTFVSSTNSDMTTLVTGIMGIRNTIDQVIKKLGFTSLIGQDVMNNPLFKSMMFNTCGILVMLPLILIYLLVQKRLFTEGVERSGLVG